eukprot:scaffold8975_cov173-Alexandrium_tamarense.AAC.1
MYGGGNNGVDGDGSQYSQDQSMMSESQASGTMMSGSQASGGQSTLIGNDHHTMLSGSVPSSAASAPGGSHGNSYNSNMMMGGGNGDEQGSVMSRSYMSQPLPMNNAQFDTSNMSAASPMLSNYQQVVPRPMYADASFVSGNSRSIANSAALIPKAKFSWASESLGTQSTVMTRRSMATASVPEPNEQRKSKAVEGRIWASFAWMITFPIPNKCIMRPTKDAKQAWREKVALFVIMVSCSVFFVGVFGFVPLLLCKEDEIFSMQDIWLQSGENWVVVHGRIYDVKDLIYRHPGGVDGIVDFLGKDASKVFPRSPPIALPRKCLDMEKVDAYNATDLYEALFGSSEYIACLEEMFYTGLLDDEFDTFCYTLNIMMYCMLVFVALLMVIQFLASMIYICPRNRTYTEEDVMSPVMVMVPCYNEGDNELRKTIKSVLNTTYPDENKVLFMVADGLVTGNGEDMSTPEHLANILGFDIDEFEDDTFEYDCIGVVHTKNRARVYHGILQKGHKFLKYIAIVKCGLPEEATTSAKPGNRGKRDSQLITIGYYNRIHYGRELTELDSAIQRAMVDLNLQADMVRFLMAIDADTRVDTMSITHMVYGMDKKEKVLALCGETKVDNKASSWVTMIQ